MSRTSKEKKVSNYRSAMAMQDKNPGLSWTQCCTDCHTSSRYPYLPDDLRGNTEALHVVTSAINLDKNSSQIGLILRDRLMYLHKDDLKTPEYTDLEKAWALSNCSSDELLSELKARGVKNDLSQYSEKELLRYLSDHGVKMDNVRRNVVTISEVAIDF